MSRVKNLQDPTNHSGSPIHSAIRLLPYRALSRWAIWYCFAKLLSDIPTIPFHRKLELSLQGSVHWNKRRSVGRSAAHQLGSAILRSSFFVFLSRFVPSCQLFKKDVSNSATQDSIMNVHN
ncbi:hypothetical protein H5410_003582 [Solanum commersonii]|uniref:Uncharacterized protein n=1 Tax=Solanum commersonii TaxID=4109 RepID=A0A9J6B5A6_SOLCO|nr:hypothetical protein H5410_003582 [Solanum commersonii]